MNLLHLDSSILGAQSAGRLPTQEIVAHLKVSHPAAEPHLP